MDLKVYTPKGLALEVQASEVSLPSEQGQIGILVGHARYVGLVGTGVLEYLDQNANGARRLVLSGGFCSCQDDQISVLADELHQREKVDRESYAKRRGELLEIVENAQHGTREYIQARRDLDIIEAIDELLSH